MIEKNIIHCIGDSHVSVFSGKNKSVSTWPNKKEGEDILPHFRTYKVGPSLAYNLFIPDSTTQGRKTIFEILKTIKCDEKILFCFGEIDCRAQILKQSQKMNLTIEKVIRECVDRYHLFLKEVKQLGYQLIIWNVVPSTFHNKISDRSFPVYGSCQERNKITILFNSHLNKICKENNMVFIDIFYKLVDENLLTKKEYFFDSIHLNQKTMPFIMEEMKKYFFS